MAPKLPRGFGANKKDDKTSHERARPLKTIPKVVSVPEPLSSKKRDLEDVVITNKIKKLKMDSLPSVVDSLLGPLAAMHISEKELKSWQQMSSENANEDMIKAAAKLLVHSLGRAQRLTDEKVQRAILENDKLKLEKQIKELEKKLKIGEETLKTKCRVFEKEMTDQAALLKKQTSENLTLSQEKDQLRARLDELIADRDNNWAGEKEKLEDAAFERGFNFYLTGFLANDSEYSWEKWPAGAQADVNDFRITHAAEIKAKRVELGLEEASPEEGAPSSPEQILPQPPQDPELQPSPPKEPFDEASNIVKDAP